MSDKEPWYMGERAQNLAILALTDHSDVSVIPRSDANIGVSILANIRESGESVGRLFGVDVRAMLSGDLRALNLSLDKNSQLHYRDVPFPVCLFLFTVDNGWGYWGWIHQPAFGADGTPLLLRNEGIALKELDSAEVNNIVHAVTHWYDHRNHHSVGPEVGNKQLAGALV
ncbi:MAG: DUF4365 domain-containing protein [Armatimonadota bacterium]|nr:DUF4365 domain-containing protein [Armatimonadota bacterium]